MPEVEPVVSIVVTTYERPREAREAVKSVIEAQLPVAFEIVVVDDGSSPAAAALLDESLSGELAVRVVRQPNAGLTAARILGAASANGLWLGFLDDDDRLLPGWGELVRRAADGLAIVSGSARLHRPDGTMIRDDPPRHLGPVFDDITAQFLAGTFIVRRDVYEAAGGYLPGLSWSHQSELFIRCAAVAAERSLPVGSTTTPVARIERRDESERALLNPRLVYDGTRWVLSRHGERFARDRRERANWEGVAAVNAARLRDPDARMHAARSVMDCPSNLRAWTRLVVIGTPVSRWRWRAAGRSQTVAESQRSPLRQAVSFGGSSVASLCARSDFLFLPWRYEENPPGSTDTAESVYWPGDSGSSDARLQDPVYRWAGRLVRKRRARVLDVGCGTGEKLVRHVAAHADSWWGVDQRSAMELAARHSPAGNWMTGDLAGGEIWEQLGSLAADLVLCIDVIEHVEDPVTLLENLAQVCTPGGRVLLSTPDRSRLEAHEPLGPPGNPRHVREWTEDEMRLLVEAAGFEVKRLRHLLPRSYSLTYLEAKRVAHRLINRRALPDRRSCMALLLAQRASGSAAIAPTGSSARR